jgi:glycosyltransferase involved in cell wall biosynthesis
VQTVTRDLAEGLCAWSGTDGNQAIEVTLITQTPAGSMDDSAFPFRVVRRPRSAGLLAKIWSADVVHLASPAFLPLVFAWFFRKPTVVEHHGYQSICPNGLLLFGAKHGFCPSHFMAGNYRKCLECNSENIGRWGSFRILMLSFVRRWLTRRVSVNVVPSHHIGNRIALPHTQLIHHGVEPVDLLTISPQKGVDYPPARYAFVGRLVKEKGVAVLLRAAHQLSQKGYDLRLQILGDGPERGALENLATELGIKRQTEFLGWVPAETVTNVLAETNAVVMPSLWEDVAPLVAIEQMMQGRLVIASDVGGLGETVDGFGLKFPAGDADALESCMRRVIEDRNSITELRKLAQQHAFAAFQRKRMVEEHRSVYLKLARSPSEKAPNENRSR